MCIGVHYGLQPKLAYWHIGEPKHDLDITEPKAGFLISISCSPTSHLSFLPSLHVPFLPSFFCFFFFFHKNSN